jgi:hypothetical protein
MKHFCLFFILLFASLVSFGQNPQAADSLIFCRFLDYAAKEKVVEKQTGDRMVAIARFFMDTPYVASTLEADGPERLQVNLRELDCTTFVETVLALHNVLKQASPDYQTFRDILTSIRYRDGIIRGYPARLHYITDWLFDNRRKGFIRFVKMGCASIPFKPGVGFMSAHPEAYKALKSNPAYVDEMADQERRINNLKLKYLPKEKLTPEAPFIHTGDIVTITTNLKGLDFSHLGFAFREKGVVYLLHASQTGKKVLISSQSLKDYLADIKKHTGIVVVRPL